VYVGYVNMSFILLSSDLYYYLWVLVFLWVYMGLMLFWGYISCFNLLTLHFVGLGVVYSNTYLPVYILLFMVLVLYYWYFGVCKSIVFLCIWVCSCVCIWGCGFIFRFDICVLCMVSWCCLCWVWGVFVFWCVLLF